MPVLSNPKHEAFAQALAKGKTQVEAYAEAGYKPNDGHAARLAGNGRIANRLAEILAKAAQKTERTLDDMVAQFDEDRAFARSLENPAAAISATTAVAKLLGHWVDKKQIDVKHTFEEMPDDELDRELMRAVSGEPLPESATQH